MTSKISVKLVGNSGRMKIVDKDDSNEPSGSFEPTFDATLDNSDVEEFENKLISVNKATDNSVKHFNKVIYYFTQKTLKAEQIRDPALKAEVQAEYEMIIRKYKSKLHLL